MSSKLSLIFTDQEHWYIESLAGRKQNVSTPECIVLELESKHKIEINKDTGQKKILIESDTPLYRELVKKFYPNWVFDPIDDMKKSKKYESNKNSI